MEGWFFSPNFRAFQKVNGKVYVYITPRAFDTIAQLYLRGTNGYCTLEVRTNTDPTKLFDIAEKWLQDYGKDLSQIEKDPYHIANPNGVWGNPDLKKYYI